MEDFNNIMHLHKKQLDLCGIKVIMSNNSTFLLAFDDPTSKKRLEQHKSCYDTAYIEMCDTPHELEKAIQKLLMPHENV